MKNRILVILCFCFTLGTYAQSVIGAWEGHSTSDAGEALKTVVIFTDGYMVSTLYNAKTGEFLQTKGGSWTLNNNTLSKTIEFNTENPEQVGTTVKQDIDISGTQIELPEEQTTWTRIDDGTPGELEGAWLMSGRVRNGDMQTRSTDGPRKTMKILSGTRFQWIAYNTETKEFKGTGGGTYTTKDGKYTENIAFFSKDQSRVGQSLEFNFELIDGNWHHSGKSSKGDPMHEVWSLRK